MTEEVEIELDDAREVMHDRLVEMFGEDLVQAELDKRVAAAITQLYDEREQLENGQQA
jgi:hypothetical protein